MSGTLQSSTVIPHTNICSPDGEEEEDKAGHVGDEREGESGGIHVC